MRHRRPVVLSLVLLVALLLHGSLHAMETVPVLLSDSPHGSVIQIQHSDSHSGPGTAAHEHKAHDGCAAGSGCPFVALVSDIGFLSIFPRLQTHPAPILSVEGREPAPLIRPPRTSIDG